MKKPLIALIAARALDGHDMIDRVATSYTQAVTQNGAIPVILPNDRSSLERLLPTVDGVMMLGGIDVHPETYQEPVTFAEGMMKEKDVIDEIVIRTCLELDLPLLAICRGMQVTNAILCGTLIQDIPQEVPGALNHGESDRQHETVHDIQIEDSRYFPNGTYPVNSLHHQSIKKIAPGLHITARSSDGVIEMIEMPERESFFLGVQWHPECIPDQPLSRDIFEQFLEAARNKK